MRKFLNRLLVISSSIHMMCPLCIIARRYPQSAFAKAVCAWGKICPCCNLYFAARKRGLIETEAGTKGLLPPVYFLTYLVAAIGFHCVFPIRTIIPSPYNYLGIIGIGFGVILNIWADRLFKRKRTTVKPFEASTFLIQEGPFYLSRHPMYLGMVAIFVGIAVILGSITPFFVAIAFAVAMDSVFIPAEEKSLEQSFGTAFLDYKKRVRRWI